MSDQQENDNINRGGRPATGKGTLVGVRLQPDLLAWLDAERAKHGDNPSRPELVRQMLELLRKCPNENEPIQRR